MDDAFESMEDQDELEEEADAEVEKVLWELTAGMCKRTVKSTMISHRPLFYLFTVRNWPMRREIRCDVREYVIFGKEMKR